MDDMVGNRTVPSPSAPAGLPDGTSDCFYIEWMRTRYMTLKGYVTTARDDDVKLKVTRPKFKSGFHLKTHTLYHANGLRGWLAFGNIP